ncbi:MAG: hypothetical protein M3440_09735 [Chloroflexota bacterium]|nr:hypothetical protein [Chloroflexota bacterium]
MNAGEIVFEPIRDLGVSAEQAEANLNAVLDVLGPPSPEELALFLLLAPNDVFRGMSRQPKAEPWWRFWS